MRIPLSLALASLSLACAAAPTRVDRGELHNETPWMLSDVRILLLPNQRVVSTSALVPGRPFVIGYPPREVLATRAEISWRTPDGLPHLATVDVPRLEGAAAREVGVIVYSIHADGSARVEISTRHAPVELED